MQLCLEIELDSNLTAAIIQPGAATFIDANTSTDWFIDDVRMLADTVVLDSSLQNSYTAHLLEGKSLPISYTTFVSQSHILTQQPNLPLILSVHSLDLSLSLSISLRIHQLELKLTE